MGTGTGSLRQFRWGPGYRLFKAVMLGTGTGFVDTAVKETLIGGTCSYRYCISWILIVCFVGTMKIGFTVGTELSIQSYHQADHANPCNHVLPTTILVYVMARFTTADRIPSRSDFTVLENVNQLFLLTELKGSSSRAICDARLT